MYHIVNDKRAKVSARLIYEGLLECLQSKPFNKITIRDIQEASGVGRATFYRHFDNLSDVLMAKCDAVFSELGVLLDKKHQAKSEEESHSNVYLATVVEYLSENWEIFETLDKVGKRDILYHCLMKYTYDRTKVFAPHLDEHSMEFQLLSHLRAGILDGIINMWLEDGKKEQPEEILRILRGETFQQGLRFMMEIAK